MPSTLLTNPANAPAMADEEPGRWHWTRAEFLRLADSGFFGERDAELVRGEILVREPPAPYHSGTISPLADLIRAAFGDGFHVRTEQPLVTDSADSLPQPDLVVCTGSANEYRQRYPTAAEAVLVIEVSDSTLVKDRGVKLRDYAASGIGDYWIVNLREQTLEVYRSPVDGGYDARFVLRPTESVTALSAPEYPISVAAILGL